jgi:hypothetical protein
VAAGRRRDSRGEQSRSRLGVLRTAQRAGWGTAKPARIFNGGDPSGLVTHIRWASWGGSTANGHGLNWIFKPGGGY